ncbi:hypothetical protein F5Y18DRAFT_389026 [Xylariaceae sp. FL1019]|nr:hypothetical protein F5Y18DRAFT_389026 [Xylariaceae sp. FL1019]
MSLQQPSIATIGVLAVAILLSLRSVLLPRASVAPSPVIGQNNTVLFLVNAEHGLSNVHLATAQALLERHPHVQSHFGSFKEMAPRLEHLSSHMKIPHERDIGFHPIDGPSFREAHGKTGSTGSHFPGWAGVGHQCKDMQLYMAPWIGEEHLAIYEQIGRLIDEVDPAVVVLDVFFRPAIDATRDKNRLHAFISPNTLIDAFPTYQPWGKMFWKYPAMASGIPYPVPWNRIAENVLLNLRYILTMLWTPDLKEKRAYLKSKGLKDPITFFSLHRPDVPWIFQTMPEASIPLDVVPQNVTCTGPMTLLLETVSEQDKKLANWLKRAPTVLINLGSAFLYSERAASAMAEAIATVLQSSEVQVLWKMRKEGSYGDEYMSPLRHYAETGRVRIERWLAADPPAILESGHVIVSVHHGGAGCYHEAIGSGIPQVILPQWLDLYNFAQLAEQIGVGVWGCRETSPFWTAECLSDAILKVINEANHKDKAQELRRLAQARPGRYVAAMEIAKLAGSGT